LHLPPPSSSSSTISRKSHALRMRIITSKRNLQHHSKGYHYNTIIRPI